MNRDELIFDNIREFRGYFSKLKQLIESGEINNTTNLNGPIYLQRAETYGEIICKYLEGYVTKKIVQ